MFRYSDFRPNTRFAQTLAVSPDGGWVAYADDRSGQFNVTIQPTDGGPGRKLTSFTDNTVRRVAWHPDGRSLILLADTKGDENTQIHEIDLGEAEPRRLTNASGVSFTAALGDPFSPDGRLLAYVGNDRNPNDQDVLITEPTSGQTRRVYAGGGRVYAGHWSPDGKWLTAAEWVDGNSDHIVYLLSTDGGSAIRLSSEDAPATYWLGPWLPDGSGFLVRSNAGREFTGLAVMSPATGELTWLDTPTCEVEDAALSADGRVLVWLINVDGATQMRARDLTTGTDLPMPTFPLGVVEEFALSRDGRLGVLLLSTASWPSNVAVLTLDTGQLRWLTDARPTGADAAAFIEPTLIRYLSRDGAQIPAYLYRPATVGRVGVVLSIHGGPVGQERPSYLNDGFYQYLLSRGIAVLAPNVRGSWGYGIAYQKRIYRDWGGVDLEDFAAAVEYLRAQDCRP